MEFENIRVQQFSFFAFISLDLDNSVIIIEKLSKFGVVILDIITEGTMSHLGPSYFFYVI